VSLIPKRIDGIANEHDPAHRRFIRHKQWRIYPPQTMTDLSATNNGGFIRHKQWRIYPPRTMAD
jgi:hypothetical protein